MDVSEAVVMVTETPDGDECRPMAAERRRGGMTLTCMECGRDVTFENPTPSQVLRFLTSHRCGPGPGWQGT